MKLCPLAAANPKQENSDCLGEACACYVQMQKPRVLQNGRSKTLDEEHFLCYFGCGLVAHIPWKVANRESNSKPST